MCNKKTGSYSINQSINQFTLYFVTQNTVVQIQHSQGQKHVHIFFHYRQ
jgi:hypothetical protein